MTLYRLDQLRAGSAPATLARLVTADQMRAREAAAFAAGLSSFTAMQRAGDAVMAAILDRWTSRPTLVLCGGGNNGGDGYIVAAGLKQRGWPVSVVAVAAPKSGDAQRAAGLWAAAGGNTIVLADHRSLIDHHSAWPDKSGLIVDALFGIGLIRPIDGDLAELINQANNGDAPVIAIDIPSGINSDTGDIEGIAIKADVTVTFGWMKPGHALMPGSQYAGETVLVDIGLSAEPVNASTNGVAAWANVPLWWQQYLPRPAASDHKFTRGHLLAVGGGVMTGAIRLGTRAARRAGIGLATILAPSSAVPIYAADQPGVIVRARPLMGQAASGDDIALSEAMQDQRISVVLVGSGLLPSPETTELVKIAIASKRPCVIDGGGLDAIPGLLTEKGFSGNAETALVLTPHEGEFQRLCPDVKTGSKIDRALTAARRFNALIALKGPDTVIASPTGEVAVNGGAPAFLATAGSGDVLAGLIAGLIGQRMPAFPAVCAAVWLHAEAARLFGPGLLAEDLPELLPSAIAGLLSPASLPSRASALTT